MQSNPMSSLDPRFGAVEAFRASPHAAEAGVCWTRLVFWWSGLQADGPTSWNPFYFPDDLLQAELDAGRVVVGLLINTPPWAGHGGPNSVPTGLELPVDDAGNFWARFAATMAENYRGRIDHWVIWNEPDIWDPASPTYTWDGTDEQFARLQKVAYLAMKRANPRATVGLPGLTYWWDVEGGRKQYLERYLDLVARDPEAAANNWFFDAAVLHLYNEPAGLFRVPQLYKELLAARGLTRPIWINETNVAPWDDPANPMPRADFRATMDEQASYFIQASASALAAGAEHISVYPWCDGNAPPGQELMGPVRGDGSTRPAYSAFQTITRYFRDVRAAGLVRQDSVVRVTLERPSERITVAWCMAPEGASTSVTAAGTGAVLVDKFGKQQPIAAVDGSYALTLQGATANTVNNDPSVYLIGGDPVLLVEAVPDSSEI